MKIRTVGETSAVDEELHDDLLLAFPDVEAAGRDLAQQQPTLYRDQVNMGSGGDIAVISTTSGTTSRPKLAQLTHDNLMSMGRGLSAVDAYQADHQFVSFLEYMQGYQLLRQHHNPEGKYRNELIFVHLNMLIPDRRLSKLPSA